MTSERFLIDIIDASNYGQLLQTYEWRKKRQEILIRDNWKCSACGKSEKVIYYGEGYNNYELFLFLPEERCTHLHIHHKVYRKGVNPIDQPNEDLITLCNICHESWHNNNDLMIIENGQPSKINRILCDRCGGIGYIPQYKHIRNGICFKCWGIKYVPNYKFDNVLQNNSCKGLTKEAELIHVNITMENELIEHIKESISKGLFEQFLLKLRRIVETLHLSNYDENLLITTHSPWKEYNAFYGQGRKIKLRVQVGEMPLISYEEKDSEVKFYTHFHLSQDEEEETKRIISYAKDHYKQSWSNFYNPIQRKAGSYFVFSQYFRQFHNSLLYKLALDEKYKISFLSRL